MNQMKNPPNTYDAGLEFNYAVWTADTVLTLTNVPWNNDYRDIVKFADKVALNTYINSMETANTSITNSTYAKVNVPVSLDIAFNKASRFNYLRASNPLQPIMGGDIQKDYYYFITDVRYIAPNNTQLVLQLDVWQTYGYDVTFGNCYIERGHIGVANENQFINYGRDFLTVPEGIDTGSEYQVIARGREDIANLDLSVNQSYDILICSATDLLADAGTKAAPNLDTAKGGYFNVLPSGASFYVFPGGSGFGNFMTGMKEKPWITQGIISITVIPPITRWYPDFVYDPAAATGTPTLAPGGPGFPKLYPMYTDWRNATVLHEFIPARYRHLRKFWTYPYMAIELTTWYGKPVIVKPESWNDPNATILERVALVPPGQRVTFHPRNYNNPNYDSITEHLWPDLVGVVAGYAGNDGDDGGDYLDIGTQIDAFPSVPIVNSGAIGYLASNANGLQFQNQSADWSQQRALRGNEVAYDQATRGMELATDLLSVGRTQDALQTALTNNTAESSMIANAVGGVATGAGMGAIGGPAGIAIGAAGGIGSGVMQGIHTSITTDANRQAQAIRAQAAIGGNRASNSASGYIRDTNKSLADWAAKGDYENQIAGLNAKVRDANLIQPSMSGQFAGEAANFINNTVELSVRWKLIDPAAIRVIGEYWLRFGYAVRQFGRMPASLMVMSKFTYWKLTETYITAAGMPETFKQAIRGIFEKGVTVWASPADIGNIDIADNTPLGGITL